MRMEFERERERERGTNILERTTSPSLATKLTPMQEIHSIGGAPRFFSGSGGDRRLRPHHQNQQALKCPRCDSLNTKFCYYNNYNLSQPRHFCKNCRRYWTKGGVLRNVPVGGGCRKSKRSSKPSKLPSDAAPPPPDSDHNNNTTNNSHSSTDSSTLTAAATDSVSAPPPNSDSNTNTNTNTNSVQELIPTNSSVLETDPVEHGTGDCGGIFSEIGPFTSLIATASTNEALAFGFDASSFQWHHHNNKAMNTNILSTSAEHHPRGEELLKLAPETSLLDHTVDLNAMHGKTAGHGGFGSLDYQGLFDLPNTVDHAYWSHTHWSDHDNSSLFHLP